MLLEGSGGSAPPAKPQLIVRGAQAIGEEVILECSTSDGDVTLKITRDGEIYSASTEEGADVEYT